MNYWELAELTGIEPECDQCAAFVKGKIPGCSHNECDGIEFFEADRAIVLISKKTNVN